MQLERRLQYRLKRGGRWRHTAVLSTVLAGCAVGAGGEAAVGEPVALGRTQCPVAAGRSVAVTKSLGDPWLRLMSGNSDDFLYRVTDALMTEDAVYVINAATELLKYSHNGVLLGRAGGAGEGPGEFRLATGIDRYRDNTLVVFDRVLQRVSVWTRDLQLVAVRRLEAVPNGIMVGALPDGRVVVRGENLYFGWPPTRDTAFAVVYQADGTIRDTLAKVPHTLSYRLPYRDGWRPGTSPFGGQAWIAATGGAVFIASSDETTIGIWNAALDRKKVLAVGCEKTAVSDDMIAEYVRWRTGLAAPGERADVRRYFGKVPFADSIPAFGDVVFADDGDIWLGEYPHYASRPQLPLEWIVVDRDGVLKEKIVVPGALRIFQVGAHFILGVTYNDLRGETVVAFGREGV